MHSDSKTQIDPVHLEKLKSKARENGLSVNEFLTSIVKSYFEWDEMVSNRGFVPVQEETLQAFLNYTPEDDIKRLAMQAADRFTDRLLQVKDKVGLDDFLAVMRIRLALSGFSYSESADSRGVRLTINHGIGYRWSVYFANNTERVVQNLGHAAKITTVLDDSWTIHIKKYGV